MNENWLVIAVTGGPGAGKTHVISRLAEAHRGQGAVVVLSFQAAPVNLDPLLYPSHVKVMDGSGGGDCSCGCHDAPLGEVVSALELSQPLVLMECPAGEPAGPLLERLALPVEATVLTVRAADPGAPRLPDLEQEADHAVVPVEEAGEPGVMTLVDLPGLLSRLQPVVPRGEALGAPHHHDQGEHGSCSHCHHDDHDRDELYTCFSFACPGPVDREGLLLALQDLPAEVLWAKGLVNFIGPDEEVPHVVDRQGSRLNLRPLSVQALPEVLQPDGEPEDDPDTFWMEGTSLLLLWTACAEDELPDLELALHRAVGGVFLVSEEPPEDLVHDFIEEDLFLEAITVAREQAARSPQEARGWEQLARGYHRIGDNFRAFRLLYRALDAEPEDLSVHLNLCRLYLAHDELEEAQVHLDHARKVAPGDREVRLVQGRIELAAGEHEQAIATLEALDREEPLLEPDLLVALCDAHSFLGHAREALAVHERVVSLYPQDSGTLFAHGRLLLAAGEPRSALIQLDRARAGGNDFSWVMLLQGVARRRLGQEEEARRCLEEALMRAREQVEEYPDMDSFVAELALAELAAGEIEAARGRIAWLRDHAPEELEELALGLRSLDGFPEADLLLKEVLASSLN